MLERAEVLAGGLKALPVAAVLGAISAKDALAYAGIVSMLSAILVVGALWGSAKAWRERAEARADEADQLERAMVVRDAEIEDLHRQVIEVKAELKARPDLRPVLEEIRVAHAALREADAEEHRAIVAALDRLSGSMQQAITANTTALETLAKNVPWAEITGRAAARTV